MQKHFFGKCLLQYKFRFPVEKTNKKIFGTVSKLHATFFVLPLKNASHTISICGGCMINVLFSKKNFFYHQTVLLYSKQKLVDNFLSTIFRFCTNLVAQAFFFSLDVWNCMI